MLLQRFLKAPVFLQDRRGGVAPMFALAIIPVVGLVGAAIDYSRANSVKAGMQSALDATALAMAKLAPTLTQSRAADQDDRLFPGDVQPSRSQERHRSRRPTPPRAARS